MRLKDMFKSKTTRFIDAVMADDFAAVGKMLDEGYMPTFDYLPGGFTLDSAAVALQDKASIEMLRFFVQKTLPRLNKTDFFANGSRYNTDALRMATHFIDNGHFDKLQMLIDEKANFNDGKFSFHPFERLVQSHFKGALDKERMLGFLDSMMAQGIDQIAEVYGSEFFGRKDSLSYMLVGAKMPEAFELAVQHGLDLHANGEQALRFAAERENESLCRYLIDKHGADTAHAIEASKKCGNEKIASLFLLSLSLKKEEHAPTIESLSLEVQILRENIAELTGLVRQQVQGNNMARLDKKKLNP